MKIIEGLRKIKQLDRKIKKNILRITDWSSYLDNIDQAEKPLYGKEELRVMIQQIGDWSKEKARIRHNIHITNALKKVIFKGTEITVDELLLLQSTTIPDMLAAHKALNRKDKGRFGVQDVKTVVRLQYDPKEKEVVVDSLLNDLEIIGDILDRVTLETDIIE